MKHISGKDFDVMIGDYLVHIESFNVTITDERAPVKSGGVPNGYVDGDCACSGDLELDSRNFMVLSEAARSAGSWKGLEPFDINAIAVTESAEIGVELFGCMLKISDLLAIDPNGKEKKKHKIGFDVTDKEFVRINGVPYLTVEEIADII